MSGTLSLVGMADGLLIGNVDVGPVTTNGKRVIGEILEVQLEANVDYVVKIPSEAVSYALVFTFSTVTPGEIRVGSNLVATASGMPVATTSWFKTDVPSGMTELKFKASAPPAAFQLIFI